MPLPVTLGSVAPLEHTLQVVRQDRERADLLLDVGAAMALVRELDVLEVLAFSLAELDELVSEYARLRNRTPPIAYSAGLLGRTRPAAAGLSRRSARTVSALSFARYSFGS